MKKGRRYGRLPDYLAIQCPDDNVGRIWRPRKVIDLLHGGLQAQLLDGGIFREFKPGGRRGNCVNNKCGQKKDGKHAAKRKMSITTREMERVGRSPM